ncbi:MAG: DEAD/DEAH box helicase [Saprospiraceae bacterium]|nr:DEAD/DEAH box helicase [Saprospiraceae bacterium]
MTFKETGLKPEIISAISELGFETPTPIQQETIPFILGSTQDLVALAQTGTGKTAAFGLPMLNQIDTDSKATQALILCPTRELCLQIANDLESYLTKTKGVFVQAVYGGTPISNQIRALKKGVQVVVGTPGRTLDLIKRKVLKVNHIQWAILDEADEMLNMGFKDDLEAILADTPSDKQTLLFSATMPKTMEGMVRQYMDDPHRIQVARQNIGAKNVAHHFYITQARNRYATLQRLVDAFPNIYAIIFCRTRRETQDIADKLMVAGYNADTIHGDLSQAQRDSVMKSFKNRNLQMLVATDVAARGIDVDELTHVINYQLPDDPEVYIHRSGRTGRAGNKGISISIIHSREGRKLGAIEKMVGKTFEKQLIPTGKEICETQLMHLVDKVKTIEVEHDKIEQFLPAIYEKLDGMDREQLIKHFVSAEFNRFLKTYKGSPDLNVKGRSDDQDEVARKGRGGRRDREGRKTSKNYTGFEVPMGIKHRMNPKRLIALVNEQTDSNDITIGDIVIKQKFTYFEVGAEYAKRLEEAFEGFEYQGQAALSKSTRKPEPTQRSKRNKGKRDDNFSSKNGGERGFSDRSRRNNTKNKSKGKPKSARKGRKRR